MNYDTIKLLNLEDININLEKSDIIKIDNTLYCNIVLTQVDESCPLCESINYTIKDYRKKEITHSISTANPVFYLTRPEDIHVETAVKYFMKRTPIYLIGLLTPNYLIAQSLKTPTYFKLPTLLSRAILSLKYTITILLILLYLFYVYFLFL